MKYGMMLALAMMACTPGQAKQSGTDYSNYEWEEGAQTPKIFGGEVYCTFDEAGFYLFFIDVFVGDPQGSSDIKEGNWYAYLGDSTDILESDTLVCDGQECLSSFNADVYPSIPCAQLKDFRFEADILDYSGNRTEMFELTVLGEVE